MDMNAMRNWRWMILLMHSNSFRVHRKIEILKRSNQQGKEKKKVGSSRNDHWSIENFSPPNTLKKKKSKK